MRGHGEVVEQLVGSRDFEACRVRKPVKINVNTFYYRVIN